MPLMSEPVLAAVGKVFATVLVLVLSTRISVSGTAEGPAPRQPGSCARPAAPSRSPRSRPGPSRRVDVDEGPALVHDELREGDAEADGQDGGASLLEPMRRVERLYAGRELASSRESSRRRSKRAARSAVLRPSGRSGSSSPSARRFFSLSSTRVPSALFARRVEGASMTKTPWGAPKPRKAVKGGRLVRHMRPVTRRLGTR